MLASDLANREFSGAENPDARLAVTFYIKPVQQTFLTQKDGKPVFRDVEYVRIEVPGDRNLTLDVPAYEEHQLRFPLQYARFKNMHKEEQLVGVSVDQWPLLTRSQAEELKAMKFRTVEQIAAASDAQIQNIGMIGGMAPAAFRERAIAYLAAAKDSSFAELAAQRNAEKDAQIQEMREQHEREMAQLREQLAALTKAVTQGQEAPKPRKAQPQPAQQDI